MYRAGDRLLVFVNGAGRHDDDELSLLRPTSTPSSYGPETCGRRLRVGNYLTTQELSGVSLSWRRGRRNDRPLAGPMQRFAILEGIDT
jgi:hypothetical protein